MKMEELDNLQNSALQKLRSNLQDVLKLEQLEDDRFLLRWLRARDYDVPKAEKMLKESLKWREAYDVDNILTNFERPELAKLFYPISRIGFDKEGCPIILNKTGKTDGKGLVQCVKWSHLIKTIIWVLEDSMNSMITQSMKLGRMIETHYIILDMDGVSIKQVTCRKVIDILRELVQINDNNYPETLKKIMIINASRIFFIAYALIKPFMAEATIKKINIYGRDKWQEVLLQDIDSEVLPVHWGGTRTDGTGDPTCPTIIPKGGDIPRSFMVTPSVKMGELDGVVDITVANGSTFLVEAEITEPGSVLKWIFGTEKHDISFGVYRKTPSGLQEYLPKERVNSHLVAEDGELECLEPGTYMLEFDNSSSILRSKKVIFKLEVIPPESANMERGV